MFVLAFLGRVESFGWFSCMCVSVCMRDLSCDFSFFLHKKKFYLFVEFRWIPKVYIWVNWIKSNDRCANGSPAHTHTTVLHTNTCDYLQINILSIWTETHIVCHQCNFFVCLCFSFIYRPFKIAHFVNYIHLFRK